MGLEDQATQQLEKKGLALIMSNPGALAGLFGGCGCVGMGLLVIGVIALGAFSMNNEGAMGDISPIDGYGTSGAELANADALTEEQIEDLLTNKISYGYNLKGYSKQIHDSGHMFNINPLFALAIANKDSSLGTAGAGETCRNPGNMMNRDDRFAKSGVTALGNCADIYGGSSRWSAFATYGDGMQAKAWLLRANYLDQGLTTLPQIINKYCPPSECDVAGYVKDVENFMTKYGDMYK